MFQDFIMWMQEPGMWNDGVVVLAVLGTACVLGMIFSKD